MSGLVEPQLNLPSIRSCTPNKAIPFFAQAEGFFNRVQRAENPSSVRLLSRHGDPLALEIFLTATTAQWLCYKDEDRHVSLHCVECPLRQQRECALWSVGRAHHYRMRLLDARAVSKWFVGNDLAARAEQCLQFFSLRLRRHYRVSDLDMVIESEAYL